MAYLDQRDPARLIEYGDRLGNRAIFKRLGYLIETLNLDPSRPCVGLPGEAVVGVFPPSTRMVRTADAGPCVGASG